MSSSDVSPVVDRIVALIKGVAAIGKVYPHDIWARDDLAGLIVSKISGVPTLRAWWVSGPRMDAEKVEQRPAGYQQRTWTYTVHGIEGLSANDGDDILTLRTKALAVSDALDADFTLNGTSHRTWPCTWPVEPDHRAIAGGIAVGYVEIAKRVLTLSQP